MDILEAIQKRHSVRSYKTQRIETAIANELKTYIDACNAQSGMHIQLCLNEPNAFNNFLAHYGSFKNVNNYIAIVGKKGKDFEEMCGYWGEKVVLKATQLGLSTCWVAVTYSKRKSVYQINQGEKLCCVIALGYGETEGVAHKNKPLESVCKVDGQMPEWFKKPGSGFYTKLDLGIVKCHFEIGAGNANWKWKA